MRILIAAPRKTGGAHLRCLLASVYGLAIADPRRVPTAGAGDDIPDGTVSTTDRVFTTELAAAAAEQGLHLVAIVRHPFDLFLSTYLIAQYRRGGEPGAGDASDEDGPFPQISRRAMHDPAVLRYIEEEFAEQVSWLLAWHRSGATIVRYERLAADPAGAPRDAIERIAPVAADRIQRAVLACPAENLVRGRPGRGRRMPEVTPESWREELPQEHLAVLRTHYAGAVRELGYEDEASNARVG